MEGQGLNESKHPKWLDRHEYPFDPKWILVNGQRLHYIDEGAGPAIVFVHGTPSWSFDFRHVISNLVSHFRCIAIDHIGFGLSDKPEKYDYSTQNHSETLRYFLDRLDLDQFVLVVHDFGGPIGLNYALHSPEKILGLVLLNTWMWSSADDPDFIRMRKILKSPLLPFLYRYLNFSPKFILPSTFGKNKPSKHIMKHYTCPFADGTQRNGALAFARSLLYDQGWFQGLWQSRHIIAHKPMLILWGMRDPVIKPHYLAKFQTEFPEAHVVKFENAGHFPQEEEPEKVAASIRDWYARNF